MSTKTLSHETDQTSWDSPLSDVLRNIIFATISAVGGGLIAVNIGDTPIWERVGMALAVVFLLVMAIPFALLIVGRIWKSSAAVKVLFLVLGLFMSVYGAAMGWFGLAMVLEPSLPGWMGVLVAFIGVVFVIGSPPVLYRTFPNDD